MVSATASCGVARENRQLAGARGIAVTRKLLLVGAGILVGLLLSELTLRAVGFSEPSLYVPDERRGHALLPGAKGWWRSEGEAYVRINSRGLRDREHDVEKPAGTLRIAVIGDSFAEALQVRSNGRTGTCSRPS
jgi:hypothetical protein